MALNLSTLTSPATSGNVLEQVTTTADFLDSVPVLSNLADPSGATDAKQSVALNQPKALPLIENPGGELGGYLYIPDVAGNYAEGPSVTIGANQTWEAEVDMVITDFGPSTNYILPMGGGNWPSGFGLIFYYDGDIRLFSKGFFGGTEQPSGVTLGSAFNAKYGFDGTNIYVDIDDTRVFTATASGQSSSITHPLQLNQQAALTNQGNYAIQKAKLTVNNAVVFDCDFNGSTSIRHGDTKFQAAVGGPVTLTRAGNDPLTVVKKSVLRFDGVNSSLQGLFANNIDSGYMFAAFSVLGGGGENYGRVFSVANSTEGQDYASKGVIFSIREATTNDLGSFYNSTFNLKNDLFDDDNGDILNEVRILNNQHLSKTNNTAALTHSRDTSSVDSDTFNISGLFGGLGNNAANAALDLEYLALFPATITDAQADDVRKYINNRNTVFLRHDTDGYYFYDAQKAPVGAISSGSASWNGRIVGSDNGDTDRYLTQGTSNDQPVSDGYVVTFADNTDHLEIPSTTQAGWQVVGTSLGTFAYKVNANAVTELNLLGNLGNTGFRKAGDLYGIILLPESATGREINEAKKLLTDRGASEGATADVSLAWHNRRDIVRFDGGDMSNVTNAQSTWRDCFSLTSFNSELPSVTNAIQSWYNCSSLTSFSSDLSSVTNASYAWNVCNSLTSFSTELPSAINVSYAWSLCSSLTSFSTDLSSATNVQSAWYSCSSLESFSTELPSVTKVAQAWQRCSSLTSFNVELPLATNAAYAWNSCSSLTSFSTELPAVKDARLAWYGCNSLTDFSAEVFSNWNPSSIVTGVFDLAWDGCSSLTSLSVENILTSIDSSGKHGTSNGLSGGTPLSDSGIDVDYNGDPLSAATTAAITSLKAKGWSIFINSVEQ